LYQIVCPFNLKAGQYYKTLEKVILPAWRQYINLLARINARQSWRETEIETITGITYGEATILARILDNCPTYDPDLEGSPSGIAYLEGSPSGIA